MNSLFKITLTFVLLFLFQELSWAEDRFGFSQVAYDIKAKLDKNQKSLRGEMFLSFLNSQKPLKQIYLYNYQNEQCPSGACYAPSGQKGYLEVEHAWVNGDSVEFEQDSIFIVLKLEKEIEPEQMANIHVSFLTQYGEGTVCDYASTFKKNSFFNRLWYPRLANMDILISSHSRDYEENLYRMGDYRAEINVPEEMIVVATGERKNVIVNPDRTKIELWEADKVYDFCWAADADFKSVEREVGNVKIIYYYLSGDQMEFEKILDEASQSLAFFSTKFGPYPYKTLRILRGSIVGAGASPGMVVLSSSNDVPHEISHQWWGISMHGDLEKDRWFFEGLACFSQNIYYRQNDRSQAKNKSILGLSLENTISHVYFVRACFDLDKRITSIDENTDALTMITSEYVKAPAIFEMLSDFLGEETFCKVLHTFYEEYKFSHPSFSDFAQIAEEVSGQDLDWFFDQWGHTNKKLDYALESFSSRKVKHGEGKSYANRVVVSRLGDAIMPIEVEIGLQNGEKLWKKLEGKEKIDTLIFIAPSRIRNITLDPNHKLFDINRYNNQKPIGLKFDFLNIFDFAFSSDEYSHILLFPTFSRSEDRDWEYGIGLKGKGGIYQGKVLRQEAIARHLIKSSLTYNRRRNALNVFLDYSIPLNRRKDKAFVSGVSLFNRNGKRGGELYLKRINYDDPLSFWEIRKLSLEEYEYYPLSYLSEDIWQRGKTTLLSVSFAYDDFNREKELLKGLVANIKADWSIKTLGGKSPYQKITTSTQIHRKRFLVWATLGYMNGSPMFQDKHDLAVQGNFRGFPLHQIVGKNVLAAGIEARIPTPILLGIFPFLTVGNLPKDNQVYYEGGIGLGIGLKEIEPALQFRIDFPFWENKPLAGEKEWDFKRTQIRFGVPFAQDQWYQWRKN